MSSKQTTGATFDGSALETKKPGSRLVYLDNFRIFLIISVIFHHAAIVYGGSGNFSIIEGATDSISPIFLLLFNAINQSYFMAAFFFLAGYFTPRSFEKKGAGSFLLDRIIRLAIPIAVFTILIVNLENVIISRFVYDLGARWFWTYSPGHLWFLQGLLIFAAIYVIIRLIAGGKNGRTAKVFADRFPPAKAIIVSIAILAGLTFLVRLAVPVGEEVIRLQLGHFTHYIFSFAMGVLAYRGKWLDHLTKAIGRRSGWIALVMVPVFILMLVAVGVIEDESRVALAMGGFHWQSLAYAVWETVMLFAINIFMLYFLRQHFNRAGSIAKNMAASVFAVYILHRTTLLLLSGLMYGVAIPSIVKFLIAGVGTTAICFALAFVLRKVPGFKRVLG